ncbi:MAG: hypothetical protein ACP5HK_00140 [Acidilobus sp.]
MYGADAPGENIEDLKGRVLSVLNDQGGLTFTEIVTVMSWTGDRRPLRKALSELIREGRVLREPDYQRRRIVFRKPAQSREANNDPVGLVGIP